jgi:hypothetical protein
MSLREAFEGGSRDGGLAVRDQCRLRPLWKLRYRPMEAKDQLIEPHALRHSSSFLTERLRRLTYSRSHQPPRPAMPIAIFSRRGALVKAVLVN